MYAFYEYDDTPREKLLFRSDEVDMNEYKIIDAYFESIGKTYSGFRFLGELRGRVYRMNFKLTVDGVENEYMVIHSNFGD